MHLRLKAKARARSVCSVAYVLRVFLPCVTRLGGSVIESVHRAQIDMVCTRPNFSRYEVRKQYNI